MTRFLYNLIWTLFLVLFSPYFLFRTLFQGHFRKGILDRIGLLRSFSNERPVWVHASSVGEVFCSIPLIKRIKKEYPGRPILLTTMTRTGNETARRSVPEAEKVSFLPLDHPLFVSWAVRRIQPSLLLLAETELWPNLLRSCGKKAVPVVLFNGRISDKSFRGYVFLKSLFKDCLKYVRLFLMQTEEDRNRIIAIGAPFPSTMVAGNLKFDYASPLHPEEARTEMLRALHLRGSEKVLIGGSTHSGEEEILIEVARDLMESDSSLLVILAPRHLDRIDEVERLLKRLGVAWERRTAFSDQTVESNEERAHRPRVILLDTMGELMKLYSIATVVFVGGSLVPIGGHNPLEPLFFQKCVLFGPHMFNFAEVSRMLLAEGGAIQVEDKEVLSAQLKRFLSNEAEGTEVGKRGYRCLQRHQGATERMFQEIKPFLNAECGVKSNTS